MRAFLTKHLHVDFSDGSSVFGTENKDQYRKFIRRTVLKIAGSVYEVIRKRAGQIGLYTYELRSGSKAENIYLRDVNIADEDVLWKELLVFFMNVEPTTRYLQFLKDTPALGFDPALVPDYLDCFQSDASKASVMDELEHLYECMDKEVMKARLERIGVVGAPGAYFHDDEINDSDFGEEELT